MGAVIEELRPKVSRTCELIAESRRIQSKKSLSNEDLERLAELRLELNNLSPALRYAWDNGIPVVDIWDELIRTYREEKMDQTTVENDLRKAIQLQARDELKAFAVVAEKLNTEKRKKENCLQRLAAIDQQIESLKPRITEAIGDNEAIVSLGRERGLLQDEREIIEDGINHLDDVIVMLEKEVAEANTLKQHKVILAVASQRELIETTLNTLLRDVERKAEAWRKACWTVGSEIDLCVTNYRNCRLNNREISKML